MTEISNKMANIAKNGYKSGMVRHIAQDQNRLVKQAIRLDITVAIEDLSAGTLAELYEHVKFLRRTEPRVPPEAPACPTIDEQEVAEDEGPGGYDDT